jgi:metal-dependent HD superfamily phosphatase/phosphodiesterase
MTKKYIYIPFKKEEYSFELEEMALVLTKKLRSTEKGTLIIKKTHGELGPLDSKDDADIYLVGYGIKDKPEILGNSSIHTHSKFQTLTMDKMVERLYQDGLDQRPSCRVILVAAQAHDVSKNEAALQNAVKKVADNKQDIKVSSMELDFKSSLTDIVKTSQMQVHKWAMVNDGTLPVTEMKHPIPEAPKNTSPIIS